MSAPTKSDIFEAGRREALVSPTKFDPAIIDVDGSDVNILLNTSAAMVEEVGAWLQGEINGLFLATARGEKLNRLAYDRYGQIRFEAQSAVVNLQLTRSNTTVGLNVPSRSTFSTSNGVVFETVNDVVFPAGSAGPFYVSAVSQTTGSAANVSAGTITRVLGNFPDQGLLVNNPDVYVSSVLTEPGAAAGGRDEESDDQFVARVRRFYQTVRRGTKDAIEYGALQVPRVVFATADEYIDTSTFEPRFRARLTVSDTSGLSNFIVQTAVRETLEEYRALGVPVVVTNSTPQYVNIVVSGLQFEAGSNTTAILDLARRAVLAAVNATAPRATLYRSTIIAALRSVQGLIVPDSALAEPAGDLVPTTGATIRTTLERITLS